MLALPRLDEGLSAEVGPGQDWHWTGLPVLSVYPIVTVRDLLFLFLISICLALRKTYDLAQPSLDKGILAKEAIKGFTL